MNGCHDTCCTNELKLVKDCGNRSMWFGVLNFTFICGYTLTTFDRTTTLDFFLNGAELSLNSNSGKR